MICPVLLKYPDEFISNMKVVRYRSTNPDTPSTRVSDVHDTSGMTPPPPGTPSGNHPEPVLHPRMNSRSVQRVSYNVRAPLTFHLSCHSFDCYDCFVFIVSSPLSYCPVVLTTDANAPVIDYVDDDRTPTIELPGKQSHSPLPHIAYFSIFICWTRHMLLLRYFPIQMHSLSLSPFDVPFLYPIAAYIIYIIYTAVNPALC